MQIPGYYACEKDFQRIHHALKQYPCPHCRLSGYLILHGFLVGYFDVCSHAFLQRGHRVFCSNRHNRKGCGKTVSLLLAQVLKGFTVSAHSLWEFLKGILARHCIAQALKETALCLTGPSAYRLWKRLIFSQSALRTLLLTRSPPPLLIRDTSAQTISHLKKAFPCAPNPVVAFQLFFQTSFFSP
jgi:hypothetical protein